MYRRSLIGGAAAAGLVPGAGRVKADPALVLAQSTSLDSLGVPQVLRELTAKPRGYSSLTSG